MSEAVLGHVYVSERGTVIFRDDVDGRLNRGAFGWLAEVAPGVYHLTAETLAGGLEIGADRCFGCRRSFDESVTGSSAQVVPFPSR